MLSQALRRSPSRFRQEVPLARKSFWLFEELKSLRTRTIEEPIKCPLQGFIIQAREEKVPLRQGLRDRLFQKMEQRYDEIVNQDSRFSIKFGSARQIANEPILVWDRESGSLNVAPGPVKLPDIGWSPLNLYLKYRQTFYGLEWNAEEVGLRQTLGKFRSCISTRLEVIVYGRKAVERARRLVVCPVNGLITKPRDTLFLTLLLRYEIYDQQKPMTTKCSLAAILSFLGEFVVQATKPASVPGDNLLSASDAAISLLGLGEWDMNRLIALPVINALWVGFGTSAWLKLMSHCFPSNDTWKPIVAKTSLTTVFLNPVYVLAFMIGTQLLIARNHERNLVEDRSEEAKILFIAGFYSTPIIYSLQYFFIPEKLHIPYLCGVNFLWSVFASATLA